MTGSELKVAEVKAPAYGVASTKLQLRLVCAKSKKPLISSAAVAVVQPLRAGYNSLVPDLGLQRHLAHPAIKNTPRAKMANGARPNAWHWLSRLLGRPKLLIPAEPVGTESQPKS